MSILTEFLNLFKYTQEDKNNNGTFNIETALNENWDKVEANAKAVSLALEQKADKTKTIDRGFGEKTVIAPAGSFKNLGHGEYVCFSNVTELPFSSIWFLKVIQHPNLDYKRVIAWDVSAVNTVEYECKNNNGAWTPWLQTATTDKIDISSTLVNGWVINAVNAELMAQQSGNIISLTGSIKNGTITKGTTIATLPVGFRPSKEILAVAHQYANPPVARIMRVARDGTIKIESDYDWVTGLYMINLSYPI